MFRYIWSKEIRGELYTWKSTLWLVISSGIFSFTSYLLLTNKELSLLDQTELMWLLGKVVIGTALLIVTIEASSMINAEFEKETAESLFLTPIPLKDVVIGKFLAVFTLWMSVLAVSVPYLIVASLGSHLGPAFVAFVALLGSLGVTGFVSLIFGISFLFRSSKNTLTTALIVLLACSIPALFSSALKNNALSRITGVVNPVDNMFSSLDNVLVDYHTSVLDNWQYILPIVGFCIITSGFLLFGMRTLGKQGIIKNV